MGGEREESDRKSQLVTEIYNISRRASSCAHWHGGIRTIRSPFIDWYLVLRVEEDAGADRIRKQYHKLALQLHPDKNKHPKAEVAFKLISEAYACLSDDTKRAQFNSARRNSHCNECSSRIRHAPATTAAKIRGLLPTERLSSQKLMQGFKDLRARLEEEIRVIENSLRGARGAKAASSTKESPIFNPKKDHPIFDSSDFLFRGYPHRRAAIHKKPESFQYTRVENLPNCEQRRHDSPGFGYRSRNGAIKLKSYGLV